tara:strand:- start:712 stop:1137 length:426 start_codon:yes stop_codon:yes gene_type:complete
MGKQLNLFPTNPIDQTAERSTGRYVVAVEELYVTKEEAAKDNSEIDLTHPYEGDYFFKDSWCVVYDRINSDDFTEFMDEEFFTGTVDELVGELNNEMYWKDGFVFAQGIIDENLAEGEHVYSQRGFTQEELTELRLYLQTR